MGPPHEGSIRRSDDPTTHRTMSERSYHGATSRSIYFTTPTQMTLYIFGYLVYSVQIYDPKSVSIILPQDFITVRVKSIRSWCDGSSDRSFMVDPLSYFSFQPVLHDWCKQRPWYVLSCLWDGAYKRTLAVNR